MKKEINRIAGFSMKRAIFSVSIALEIALSGFCSELEQEDERRHGVMPETHFELLENYCLDCHDSFEEEGGVMGAI